jgi:hypothetical protein
MNIQRRDAGASLVEFSAALAADLAALTQALEHPNIDLEDQLRGVVARLRTAVPSFLALTMTVTHDGQVLAFSVGDGAATVAGSSVLIPLPGPPTGNSTLTLYALTPGAFIDLAADLSFALGIELTAISVDTDLRIPSGTAGLTGASAHRAINQAIGILIDRGHTAETARHELRRLADLHNASVHHVADTVIRRINIAFDG